MILVHPDNLHDVWDFVREGLLKVSEKATDGWIPEDVYHSLKSGISSLHLEYVDEKPVGFVVLNVVSDFRGKKLFIWVAYSVEGNAVERHENELIEMARQVGCKRIAFESTRKGWEKLYTSTMITYEKDL
jgi:hypothetical protein